MSVVVPGQLQRRYTMPPLAPAIPSTQTYDIYERMQEQNRRERRMIEEDAEAADEEDPAHPSEGPALELGFVWAWRGDERVRLLGPVSRDPSAALVPAARTFAPDVVPRPLWTPRQRHNQDEVLPEDRVHGYEEVLADYLFKPISWRGNAVLPFVDRTGLVMVVGAGRPQVSAVATLIAEATRACELAVLISEKPPPAHGYMSLTAGIEYLGRQTQPRNRSIPALVQDAMALYAVSSATAIKKLMSFTDAAFEKFSPNGYRVATRVMNELFETHRFLERVTPGPWTNVTFDLGPQTVTRPGLSFPPVCGWWWMAVTALGNFDPEKGGQIILWDLGWVSQFPAGTTFFIPPMMRYSIAAIGPGETRYSMIQYTVVPEIASRWPAATYIFSTMEQVSAAA